MTDKKLKFKTLKLPVHFGGVNIGDETAAVGIRVNHDDLVEQATGDAKIDHELAVVRAFQTLCQRRLGGQIVLGRREDGETQGKFFETDVVIKSTFDTATLSIGHKSVSVRLSMAISEIDVGVLSKFAKHDGFFTITSLMDSLDIDDEKQDDDPDANDAERPMLNEKKKRSKEAAVA